MTNKKWTIQGWKKCTALQQPVYANEREFANVLRQIKGYPPLVFIGEVEKLKKEIAEAGDGKRFVLQGGDCAERFIDCNDKSITNKIKIMLEMSVILAFGAKKPVVRIGRIAGQYAKPRSSPMETVHNQEINSFRGDSINAYPPNAEDRLPDPKRLLQAYHHSAMTLNYIRAMIGGGFADLHNPYKWNLHSIEKTKEWPEYKKILDRIMDSIDFMEAFGGLNPEILNRIDFFTSHEGLLLDYEESLTRYDALSKRYYNLGAHMLWVGERTRHIDGAHVEFFRGIANPIGVKIGSTCTSNELISLLDVLNPENEKGKIVLITRFGVSKIEKTLPKLVKAVVRAGNNVTWSCDPMHGNIIPKTYNKKTNDFSTILRELQLCFNIHKKNRSHLAGVHFELTGEDVTECLGGATNLKEADLSKNYKTFCDPRLNYNQSLEMAFLISKHLQSI